MPDLIVQSPDMGLNSLVQTLGLDPREAAKGTQNILYEYGLARTPYGFSTLDLAAGLDSSNPVLLMFQWREIDNFGHLMAVTKNKIYRHNPITAAWDDKTQSGKTMLSSISYPISFAEVGHNDTNIYLDDDATKSKAYYHVVVCDGGQTDIQRWAGRKETDFADLTGGNGYHSGTTHRALQVSMSQQNRLILLSPKEYSGGFWIENNQRVRWPTIGKLQTWSGTGSGSVDLVDTGGTNVWSAPLGSQHIIYQTKGIWILNYVGGTTVFNPQPLIPDLGLKSNHLLISHSNIHYFIGTDLNVYAYYGGTVLESIGDQIHKYLQDDLSSIYENRCWIVMGPQRKRLWIFIVPVGSEYITKAYVMNMTTKKWTVRDFSSKFTSGGLTTICLAGSDRYEIGDSYNAELNIVSANDADESTQTISDVTYRYGDCLQDSSRSFAADNTPAFATWCAGGLAFYSNCADVSYDTEFTVNDVLAVWDGSKYTNCRYGTHFYTILSVGDHSATLATHDDSASIAPNEVLVPADICWGVFNPDGATYNEEIQEIQIDERLVAGDATGWVYLFDESYTTDSGSLMDCRHLIPVIDWGVPDSYKRWPGFAVIAKGTSLIARYRTASFDTSDTGWNDFTQDLSSDFEEYHFFTNVTSKRIQFAFKDFSGKDFQIQAYLVKEPLIEDNR